MEVLDFIDDRDENENDCEICLGVCRRRGLRFADAFERLGRRRFWPIREETVLSAEQIEELLELGRDREKFSTTKTTFSASETKEFSIYLTAVFFEELERKLNEYERLFHKADARRRLGLDYEYPSLRSVLVVSSEDVKGLTEKISPDAKPFVRIYTKKSAAKKMERLVKSYFNDDVDFVFDTFDSVSEKAPLVVACNPKKQKWTVWLEFERLGTNDTDLNLYFLSEGPVFGPKFEGENKERHVAALKRRLKKEREQALTKQRNAERNARASARSADRVSRQNATIQNSLETQRRLNR